MFDLKLQQTIRAHNFSIMFCPTSTSYEVINIIYCLYLFITLFF